jgi:hypothetical protein
MGVEFTDAIKAQGLPLANLIEAGGAFRDERSKELSWN